MINPFREFSTYTPPQRELPLDRILAQRARVVQHLLASYQTLLDEESKQLIWVAEQGALSRAYTTAVANLQGIDFSVEDLEDVCVELDRVDGVATPLGAPSGLFIAAMCNQVQADDICLNLRTLNRRWPFLGYRLPRGRRLRLEGDAGDFVGALLEGGEVIVTGNAGNYAGVGMKDGHVHIRHSTGKYTGEGMRGGVLRIDGHIGGLGTAKHGMVYERNRRIFPSPTASSVVPRTQQTRES
jgi:hypothetical protein